MQCCMPQNIMHPQWRWHQGEVQLHTHIARRRWCTEQTAWAVKGLHALTRGIRLAEGELSQAFA